MDAVDILYGQVDARGSDSREVLRDYNLSSAQLEHLQLLATLHDQLHRKPASHQLWHYSKQRLVSAFTRRELMENAFYILKKRGLVDSVTWLDQGYYQGGVIEYWWVTLQGQKLLDLLRSQ